MTESELHKPKQQLSPSLNSGLRLYHGDGFQNGCPITATGSRKLRTRATGLKVAYQPQLYQSLSIKQRSYRMETIEDIKELMQAHFGAIGIDLCDKIIAAHEREQWRLVSNPPPDGELVITDKGLLKCTDDGSLWSDSDDFICDKPSYWREIPQLPKELQNAK